MNTNTDTNTHENQNPSADANTHDTLRRSAANMGMPEGLSAERLAAITGRTGGTSTTTGPAQVVVRRRWIGPRRAALMASAAAVALAAGTIAVLSLSTPKVQASTILESLRSNMIHGLSVSFDVDATEGESVRGSMQMVFDSPVSPAVLFPVDDQSEPVVPEPTSFSVDLVITGHGENALAGVLRAAGGGETDWVYAKLDALPAELRPSGDDGFIATIMTNVMRNGVMVDFGPDGFNRFANNAAGINLDIPEGDMPDLPPGASVTIDGPTVRVGVDAGQPGDGEPVMPNFDHAAFSNLIRPMLTGQAGAGQIHALADLFRDAGNATVTDEGNGQYLLTATPPRLPTDPVTTEAKMMISYQEGEGVRWVRMTFDDPSGRGSMTIAPLVGVIDPARLDKANAVPQGSPAPMPIDAGMILGLLGG
jgi:hypothetical protein